MKKEKILFLCTGNSCRSQMAEAWAKSIFKDNFEIYSAGIKKHGINPFAKQVLENENLDISSHYSKTISELPVNDFDYVITVCNNAKESCPVFPGKTNMLHHSFDDPPALCKDMNDDKEILKIFSRVSNEIKIFIEDLAIKLLKDNTDA